MKYSVSEENYIKSIYHLQQQTATVSTTALANAMHTKPASVTDMLKKLQAKKLLDYEKYRGCNLNASGTKIALGIVRRHRLWEFFLVDKLGFEWDKVHAIAEELEHVNNEELVKKLDAFLNFPQTDPHGDPIPDTHLKITLIKQLNLLTITPKKNVVITAVSNQSTAILDLLKHYGMGIGTGLKVNKHFSFDGSVEIKIYQQAPCIISGQVAKNIFVRYV